MRLDETETDRTIRILRALNTALTEQLEEAQAEIDGRDLLTGLKNQTGWEQAVMDTVSDANRKKSRDYSVIVCVVDRTGPPTAIPHVDTRAVASVIAQRMRHSDVVARVAGKFLCLVDSYAGAVRAAKDLRQRMVAAGLAASFGVATVDGEELSAQAVDAAILEADKNRLAD